MPFTPQNNADDREGKPDPQDFEETIAREHLTGKTIAGATNFDRKKISSKSFSDSKNSSVNDRLIGSVVSERYKILNILGRGGMSTVYRAEHLLTKKIVALKVMHAHLLEDSLAVRRFQQEATAASRLTHPNAIQVHDLGMTESGMPYLTMDYLEGLSLSDVIESPSRRLTVAQSLDIFIQACDAIEEAHEQGIIHRDIKPSNIMLVSSHKGKIKEDVVKVLDFGIAKMTQENSEGPKLTGTGEIFGSPLYMSPEQCLGKELDFRSDIYSMGCLMYEVLCGKPPFFGSTVLATMYMQMNEMPKGLSKIDADPRFVKDLEQIVLKSLEKEPDKRFGNMSELKNALIALRDKEHSGLPLLANVSMSLSGLARSVSNKLGPSKRPILIMVAIIVLLSTIAFPIFAKNLLEKPPVLSDRYISYTSDRHNSVSSKDLAKISQNEMLVEQSRAWSDSLLEDGRSAGHFYVERTFAEKLMLKHNYSQAAERFERALTVLDKAQQHPLLDLAQVQGELAYCYLQQEQCDKALAGALSSAKIFNYIDVCSDVEALNAFATIGDALNKTEKYELAMGGYLLYSSWWDVYHDKLKEREPNRCATTALQAADFLTRSPYDFRSRVQGLENAMRLISNTRSPGLPSDVVFSPTTKVQPALKAAAYKPEKSAEDFYGYGIAILDSQGTRSAYNAGAAYNNLGLLKLKQNKTAEALSCFKKAERSLRLSEDSEDKSLALVKFSQSDCEWQLKQFQESIEDSWTARMLWTSSKKVETH